MTWSKLSDDYIDDCWELTDAAFRLHAEGLVWSNKKLLDCRIPKDHLRRFAKNPDAVQELLAVGYWSDGPGYYEILHHAIYQRTRDEVIAAQARSRMNGKKGGRPRTREVWQGGKTQNHNPAANPVGKPTANPMRAPAGSEVFFEAQAEKSENSANAGNQNPVAYPAANPEGLAFKRSSSSEGSCEDKVDGVPVLDRDSWPTDDPGLQWRIEFEEKNVETVQGLMDLSAIQEEQAKKMMAAAFPGRRF